ncbi:MAG: hypothetical protein A2X56_09655 [Nitrospirae bacterium GWC2_57_13]|jgi:two-component system, chemotaxis family, chemotaxis protein CheY|nr:MAG: hypothetical protein A2X56_09655 [Nitrospirae bacterium GWC2_57_13]
MMEREKRAVLMVDSSASMLFFLGMILTRLGYVVSTTKTAEEALRMMDQDTPTLVISELTLPKMNGINLLRRVKEAPRLKMIPVIILTAETDPGLKDTCLRAGCEAYLSKPVEPDVLYRSIQAATESAPRHYIRLAASLTVSVGDGSVLGGAVRTEYATAISEGGLYVRTLYPQPRDTLTPLTLFVGGREINAKAVVLYSFSVGEGPFKEPGMGMKFTSISEEDRRAIREFIKQQLTSDLSLSDVSAADD